MMRRFDIVEFSDRTLALLLQADLLDDTLTRAVAPLVRANSRKPTARLHPSIRVGRHEYVVLIDQLAAVPRKEIARSVMSARDREWEVRRALDLVFVGV